MVMFYVSVLRSHLLAKQKEMPINTMVDVIERDNKVHLSRIGWELFMK